MMQPVKKETELPIAAPVAANSTKRFFSGSVEGHLAKKPKIAPAGISLQPMNQSKSSWWKFGDYQRELIREMASKSPAQDVAPTIAIETSVRPVEKVEETTGASNKNGNLSVQTKPRAPFPLTEVTIDTPITISMPSLSDNQEDQLGERAETTDSDGGSVSTGDESALRFRAYQAENWTEKYEELIEFRNRLGHCLVPNHFDENPTLAQWVKRQRSQYKLKLLGKRSTMSDERVQALEDVGFVWDSHSAAWDERLDELIHYKDVNGHCNVPSRYADNRQLAIWVKRQRRQYKFHCEGKPSSMTQERIETLDALGFQWDMRVNGN